MTAVTDALSSAASIALNSIPTVVKLLEAITPMLPTAGSKVIATAVTLIAEYTPIIIAEYQTLKPIVVDAIAALAANPDTMPEQLAKLREAGKQYDAEFADALAKARAEDAADGDYTPPTY